MPPENLQYETSDSGAIRFEVSGRTYKVQKQGAGRPVVTLSRDNCIVATERVDIASSKGRIEFAETWCPDEAVIVARELEVVGHLTVLSDASDASDAESQRFSQADMLVQLAAEVELFHDATGEAFATIRVEGHFENHRVRHKGFRRWLARLFYERNGKAPGSQAMQDALTVIEGTAIFERDEMPAFVRTAWHGDVMYIDLGNEHWSAVEIDANGWRIVERPPVKFIRSRGMLPLPLPDTGGDLSELRDLLNFIDDAAWALFQSWLIGAIRPSGPYAILVLQGQHGSSKSTVARFCKALIDPSAAPIRSEPREQRDLIIAANANHVLALDNLSFINSTLSDGLCRLSTGGGFATRELYSDTDEILIDVQCPVILNGIEELVTRSDLLDRCIILELPSIPERRRKSEKELWAEFNRILPRMLGALYEAVSTAIRRLPSTRLAELPRLADFALWVAAAESSLDMDAGDFITAYSENRSAAHELTLGAAVISEPIRALIERDGRWVGTASGLLQVIGDLVDERTVRGKAWPKAPHALSNQLRRIESNLQAVGVHVSFERQSQGKRVIVLERLELPPETASPASPTSPREQETHKQAENDGDALADSVTLGVSPSPEKRHHASRQKSPDSSQIRVVGDASDGDDASVRTNSKDIEPLLEDLRIWRSSGLIATIEWPLEHMPGRKIWESDLSSIVRQCKKAVANGDAAAWGFNTLTAIHAAIERQLSDSEAA